MSACIGDSLVCVRCPAVGEVPVEVDSLPISSPTKVSFYHFVPGSVGRIDHDKPEHALKFTIFEGRVDKVETDFSSDKLSGMDIARYYGGKVERRTAKLKPLEGGILRAQMLGLYR